MTAYSIFERVQKNAGLCLSSKTIFALRDYFFGYVAALDQHSLSLDVGEPPFSQFTDWLGRRYGKSTRSLRGSWTRCHMGWWTLLSEEFATPEDAFDGFFQLLDEFRQRRPRVVARYDGVSGVNSRSELEQVRDEQAIAFKAIQFEPDQGVYLYLVHRDRGDTEDGYYGSVAELIESTCFRFGISSNGWNITDV